MQISSSTKGKRCFEHDLGAAMIWLFSCIRSPSPLISNPHFPNLGSVIDKSLNFRRTGLTHLVLKEYAINRS